MGTISIRKFIRWLPEEAGEPTSTMVLTSPERQFVDLRILKPDQDRASDTASGATILALDRLDWAIAGTTTSSMRDDGKGGQISHSQFHHWIDSMTTEPVMDEGDMFPQPDGTTLEKGSMVNPATGKDTAYEELWLDVSPPPGSKCVVLKLHDDEAGRRGLIVRLGGYCQGFMRDGGDLTLERWELSEDDVQGWKKTVRMGKAALPCLMVLGVEDAKIGDAFGSDEEAWTVVEVA